MKKTVIIGLMMFIAAFASAHAQENSASNLYAVVTWQAGTYYPADFQGKGLAVNGSTVTASVNVIKSQKLQDPSGATIVWYLDGDFFKQGQGLSQISFTVSKSRGDSHSLRADIQTKDGAISVAASVPISSPKTVIVAPYPGGIIGTGAANIEAIPYFFNVKSFGNLSFSWLIGGKEASGGSDNKLALDLSASDNGIFPVTARISNKNNQIESADGKINLFVSK
jgi:hypothetical protein